MDEDIVEELRSMDDAKMEDAFYRDGRLLPKHVDVVFVNRTERPSVYTGFHCFKDISLSSAF